MTRASTALGLVLAFCVGSIIVNPCHSFIQLILNKELLCTRLPGAVISLGMSQIHFLSSKSGQSSPLFSVHQSIRTNPLTLQVTNHSSVGGLASATWLPSWGLSYSCSQMVAEASVIGRLNLAGHPRWFHYCISGASRPCRAGRAECWLGTSLCVHIVFLVATLASSQHEVLLT